MIVMIFLPKIIKMIIMEAGAFTLDINTIIFFTENFIGVGMFFLLLLVLKKKFFYSLIFVYFIYRYFLRLIVDINNIFNIIPVANETFNFYLIMVLVIVCIAFSPQIHRMFLLLFSTTNNVRNIYIKQYNKRKNQENISFVLIEKKEKKINYLKFLITILIIALLTIGFMVVGYFGNFISNLLKASFENNKNIKETILISQKNEHKLVVYYLSIVLAAPLIEELVFRMAIISFGKNRWFVPIISGFIFAFAHVHSIPDLTSIFPYLFSGLFISYVYWWFGNYWFCFTVHFFNNVFALISILVGSATIVSFV